MAFFTRPGTSNGPTEAINARIELLRGSALGFRNFTYYIRRAAEFLHLSFGSTDSESPPKKIFPRAVSSKLLNPLTQEPGVSGVPASAWMTALQDLKERAQKHLDTATNAWDTAFALDKFLRVIPPAIHDDEPTLTSLVVAFGDPTGKDNVLTKSVAEDLLVWDVPTISNQSVSAVDENGVLRIADRRSNEDVASVHALPIRISAFPIDAVEGATSDTAAAPRSFFAHTDIPVRNSAPVDTSLPARFTASSVPSEGIEADVSILAGLRSRWWIKAARTGTASATRSTPTLVCC